MIEVYRIPVPKERLQRIPESERNLLILLGYVSNQVLMFEKLLMFAIQHEPPTEVKQHVQGAQAQMLLRLAVGALHEALEVVRRFFLSSPVGQEYVTRLDAAGLAALDSLKTMMGKKSLIFLIRNNFGFHYPEPADVERAFQAAVANPGVDDMWRVYFSHHGFNSLFLFPDAVFLHGIAEKAGEKDLAVLQQRLMDDIQNAATNLTQFSQAYFGAAWRKHFGNWIDAQDIVRIEDAPHADTVSMPFFIEVVEPANPNGGANA